ncbi:stage III sporulation protein AF [Halocella sp. SP3-1]|uniref:stage III sporulation protein AF n=1 Tax=Halocella sp. SP3-1 TaxID=2382161 RepID=UPI000F750C72|nr:stage III sporulation protein AF [Halocella sp. SP3-1]AZO95669.1 stage III sporulation protein AF [Halocella sp. SP3-1]MTI60861.1 stage III sporulation protein AF [Bacillota bacterium]
MEAVIRWVKNLVFIILFTTLLEMFLPGNKMRKYVRVVMGFFIISIFISPLSAILKGDMTVMQDIIPGKIISGNWEGIIEKGAEIEYENKTLIKDYYAEKVRGRVEEVIELYYDSEQYNRDIQVDINDEYQLTGITVFFHRIRENVREIDPVDINKDRSGLKEKNENNIGIDSIKLKNNLSKVFQLNEKEIKIIKAGGD